MVAQHERRHIVVLWSACHEAAHGRQQALEHLRRPGLPVRIETGQQPLLAKLLAGRIERFGDAIAEDREQIARLERKRLLLVDRLREQPQDQSSGLEPAVPTWAEKMP